MYSFYLFESVRKAQRGQETDRMYTVSYTVHVNIFPTSTKTFFTMTFWLDHHGASCFFRVPWEQTRTNMPAKVCIWSRLVDFLKTFSQHSQNFLSIFSQLSHNFLITFSQISHNFLTTFSKLSHNLLKTFSQLFTTFLSFFLYFI